MGADCEPDATRGTRRPRRPRSAGGRTIKTRLLSATPSLGRKLLPNTKTLLFSATPSDGRWLPSSTRGPALTPAPPTERERQRGGCKAHTVPLPCTVRRAGTKSGGQRRARGPGGRTAALQSTRTEVGISRVWLGRGEDAPALRHWGATATAAFTFIWYEYCPFHSRRTTSRT